MYWREKIEGLVAKSSRVQETVFTRERQGF
jgi:hypothetical protein